MTCKPSAIDKVLAAITKDLDTGCWEMPSRNDGGYGRVYAPGNRVPQRAHRVAYQWAKGPIPEGLEIDHLCRNRACCNPDHLEAVTRSVNIQRGFDARPPETHCKRGHLYERTTEPGRRVVCHECKRMYRRAYLERRRLANAAAL